MGQEKGQVTRLLSCGLAAALLSATLACAPAIHSTAKSSLTKAQLAELWQAPDSIRSQDLFWGPWGKRLAPDATATYQFIEEKTVGFSPGFTVKDHSGREWSVKQGPEAGVEVVVSRLLSAIGYHQPPVYYLASWKKEGGPGDATQGPGRFRPKDVGIDDKGIWSWQENPFVGTRQYGGLLAFMMLVNGSDLKNDNNSLYAVAPEAGVPGARRWYVVRDVGAALGETGRIEPRRGDPFVFDKIDYIRGVKDGHVQFNYEGRHQELFENISTADVQWMLAQVSQLSDKQWRDAFAAGGYGPEASAMFIGKLQKKLDEARTFTGRDRRTGSRRTSSLPPTSATTPHNNDRMTK